MEPKAMFLQGNADEGVSADRVVARLGERCVTLAELIQRLRDGGWGMSLRAIAEQALVDQIVAPHNGGVSLEELQREADLFRFSHGLNTRLKTIIWLRRMGIGIDGFERYIASRCAWRKMRDETVGHRVENYFKLNKMRFDVAELWEIVVATQEEAEELQSSLTQEPEQFFRIARTRSLAASGRKRAGYLGPMSRSQLTAEVAAAVFATSPGRIAGPFASNGRYHIVLVDSITLAVLDEDTAERIKNQLFRDWLDVRFRNEGFELLL